MKGKKPQLDAEEQQILADFEQGEFERIPNFRREKRDLQQAAAKALRKGKRINIRLSSRDLMQLRKRAAKEGMPYQTLISSTLHKFVSGRLKDAG